MGNKNNINLILGNHGSGKTTFVYNYFLDNCKNENNVIDLSKKFYLVVPEQDTLDKQNMFLKLAKTYKNGIINIDVVSFDRMFYMICKELNIDVDNENIIDDDLKRLVLNQAMKNLENNNTDFVYFKNMKNKIGFTDKLKSAISELYSYNIDKETLDDIINKATNIRIKNKLEELNLIQEEFKKLLDDNNFRIKEDKLNLLYKYIDKTHIFDNSIVAFDGFTGFTPIQNNIFDKICEKSNEVFVTIDIRDYDTDEIINNFGYRNEKELKMVDVFYLSKLFINQIYDTAIKQNKSINKNNIFDFSFANKKLYDEKLSKYNNKKDLLYLEENLYKNSNKYFTGNVENISIHANKNIDAEVDFLINKINYLRRKYNYSLNDIKVVVPEITEYSDVLIKKCNEYDINVYVDNNKNILNSPLIELIRSLFDVLIYNFNYDSVIRYFNCGIFEKKYNKRIYLFDNAIRKYGIKTYAKYKNLLEKKKTYIESKSGYKIRDNIEEYIDDVIDIKNELLNDVLLLYENLGKTNKKFTVIEYIDKLEDFLQTAKIYEKFETFLNSFIDKTDFDYLILSSNIKLVNDIFSKIRKIYINNKDKVDLSYFSEIFDVAIESKTIPLSPPTLEELECGDLMRSRFDNPKVLFLLGLNESKIPYKSQDNNIINDDLRIYLKNKNNIILSQTTKETALNQRFYVYLALTNPTDKLYLSYTMTNADDITDYPSSIIINIKNMFKLNINKENKENYELFTRKDMKEYVYNHLYQSKIVSKLSDNNSGIINKDKYYDEAINTKKVLTYITENKKENDDFKIESPLFDVKNNINKNLMNELIGDEYVTSVTKLETYASCPYKHFLGYILNLKERDEYGIDLRDIGTIYHKILEDVFSEKTFDIKNTAIDDIGKKVDVSINNIIEDNDNLKDTNKSLLLSERLKDTVMYSLLKLRENLNNNLTKHIASEESIAYDITNSKDSLHGKIDSIDNYKNEDDKTDYVRIVDYKSSKKEYNKKELEDGVNIQYVVYLNYALNNLKNICENHKIPFDEEYMTKPLGTFYFNVHDNMKFLKMEDDEEAKLSEINGEYKYSGIVNEKAMSYMDEGASKGNNNKIQSNIMMGECFTEEDIAVIINNTNNNIIKNIAEIKDGVIKAAPYHDMSKSCKYCPYGAVCKRELNVKVVEEENNENNENDKNENNENDKNNEMSEE